MMLLENKNVLTKMTNSTLIVLALVLLVACSRQQHSFVAAEPDSGGSSISAESGGGGDGDFGSSGGSPKRQYFIAPRIGRSGNQAAIWTALEEGALSSRGQMQPQRGFPSPLKSSLFYLINNNRRLIGPRSGGLLPQARIGRRALPMGLMPQPRVGRRSGPAMFEDGGALDQSEGADFAGGQQEVAVATLSDSSFADALESLLDH